MGRVHMSEPFLHVEGSAAAASVVFAGAARQKLRFSGLIFSYSADPGADMFFTIETDDKGGTDWKTVMRHAVGQSTGVAPLDISYESKRGASVRITLDNDGSGIACLTLGSVEQN